MCNDIIVRIWRRECFRSNKEENLLLNTLHINNIHSLCILQVRRRIREHV